MAAHIRILLLCEHLAAQAAFHLRVVVTHDGVVIPPISTQHFLCLIDRGLRQIIVKQDDAKQRINIGVKSSQINRDGSRQKP